MIHVPFRSNRHIEFLALRLLEEYCDAQEPILAPPVPVEEILERHLRLALSVAPLDMLLPGQKVLGALDVTKREVLVDASLDPEEFPDREGRYRFTLAHEIGHWRMHRSVYKSLGALALHHELTSRACGLCRRVERQADYFAACLLMPRHLVVQLWNLYAGLADFHTPRCCLVKHYTPCTAELVETLAIDFGVSHAAMRIRLEELNLIGVGV